MLKVPSYICLVTQLVTLINCIWKRSTVLYTTTSEIVPLWWCRVRGKF